AGIFVSGAGLQRIEVLKSLLEGRGPGGELRPPLPPILLGEPQVEIAQQCGEREMAAVELPVCLGQLHIEEIQPPADLAPLLIDPGLVNEFLWPAATLVHDGEQTVHHSVAE